MPIYSIRSDLLAHRRDNLTLSNRRVTTAVKSYFNLATPRNAANIAYLLFEIVVGQSQPGVGSAAPRVQWRRIPVLVEHGRSGAGPVEETGRRLGWRGRSSVVFAVQVIHHRLVVTLADVVVAIVHPCPGTAQQCPFFRHGRCNDTTTENDNIITLMLS